MIELTSWNNYKGYNIASVYEWFKFDTVYGGGMSLPRFGCIKMLIFKNIISKEFADHNLLYSPKKNHIHNRIHMDRGY